MPDKILDPASYLRDIVVKRGTSEIFGVSVRNVTVMAEANADYGYRVSVDRVGADVPPDGVSDWEWNSALVKIRSSGEPSQVLYSHFNPYQFLVDGNNLSLNVFVPELEIELFEGMVVMCQDTLQFAANFAGKIPTVIRYNIGIAALSWQFMVDRGDAEEYDFDVGL